MISAGIVGGTGYTGVELMRLLARHPKVKVTVLTSRTEAGTRVDAMFPPSLSSANLIGRLAQ